MATNQMRREAAKRKLASQQARRVQQAKRKQRITIITAVAVVVVVVVGVVLFSTLGKGSPPAASAGATPSAAPAAAPVTPASIPTAVVPLAVRPTPLAPTVSCAYPADRQPSAKPVQPPPIVDVSARGTVAVNVQTGAGAIPVTLSRDLAPCTVNSFVSLARQSFFNDTTCHRLTTSPGLQVLQCGDPTGTGMGGPGYTTPDEVFPQITYGRGILAMANTGAPNSGGSQFFMVYGTAQLPPQYTEFGSISADGLQVLDAIAKKGVDGSSGGTGDGKPLEPVTIKAATVG